MSLLEMAAALGLLGIASAACASAVNRDLRRRDRLRPGTVAAVWALYLLLGGATLLASWRRIVPLSLPEAPSLALGALLALGGLALVAAGIGAFHSFRRMSGMRADRLVESGVYRWSRNPQNVGWGLALLGLGIGGRSVLALGLALLFWAAFTFYVPIEEESLERIFGDAYRSYRARTPRYLGWPRAAGRDSRKPVDRHDHAHSEAGHASGSERGLLLVLALLSVYMGVEAVGGWWSGSLALLADAGHVLSDAGAIGLAVLAMRVGRQMPTATHTFGFRRLEVLAALANGITLFAIGILTLVEAVRRFGEPLRIQGGLMAAVATGGLLVMLASALILQRGRDESLNLRAVWLHVLTDAVGSAGVIVTGALVWAFGWTWTDLVASVAIAGLILHSAWGLLVEVAGILMEAAPGGLDVSEVRTALEGLPEVADVHDLHIWTITSGLVSLSCHLVAEEAAGRATALRRARELLRGRFGIDHSVVQVEERGCDGGCPSPAGGGEPPR